MSFFGRLFSREPEKIVKNRENPVKSAKKSGKSKNKKKAEESKNKSKNPKSVKKPERKNVAKASPKKSSENLVFNSDNEIEKYYREEKEKAQNLLKKIEKEKAISFLNVAKKRLNQVKVESHNLGILHESLDSHIKKIFQKIRDLNLDKKHNLKNIQLVRKLESSMKKLEKEALGIVLVRKKLAEKEENLVYRMRKMVSDSEDKLRASDYQNTNKLVEIEETKEKLIDEAKRLLSEENSEMFLDNKTLESIGKNARLTIKSLNNDFKNLKKEIIDTLKKKQLLEISEEKAKEKIKETEKKIREIKRKYRKVLGLP